MGIDKSMLYEQVCAETIQKDFPEELLPVYMIACQPIDTAASNTYSGKKSGSSSEEVER